MLNYTDNVRGTIVGDVLVKWMLTYEGIEVKQGYAVDDTEAITRAKAARDEIKGRCNPIGLYKGDGWDVRLY